MLPVIQLAFSESISLRFFEDNHAVLAIVANGLQPEALSSQQDSPK